MDIIDILHAEQELDLLLFQEGRSKMKPGQPLTHEQAIETWTELQRLISVGAFSERSAEHYETDTWPEDAVEESIFNLENWAARQGLEFTYNVDRQFWHLTPIEPGGEVEYNPPYFPDEEGR